MRFDDVSQRRSIRPIPAGRSLDPPTAAAEASANQHGPQHPHPHGSEHGGASEGHDSASKAEHDSDANKKRDVFDRHRAPLSQGEKEGLKTNPELKNRQLKGPKSVDPSLASRKTERQKTDDKAEAQSVPNSVFGKDRVTISAEAQRVPAITRKSEVVGVKKGRGKYLPPGINGLAAKANPSTRPPLQEFVGALLKNFS